MHLSPSCPPYHLLYVSLRTPFLCDYFRSVFKRCQGRRICDCTSILLSRSRSASDLIFLQNYDFPNNCEDYIHRIGRTGVGSIIVVFVYNTDLHNSSVPA